MFRLVVLQLASRRKILFFSFQTNAKRQDGEMNVSIWDATCWTEFEMSFVKRLGQDYIDLKETLRSN